MMTISPTVGLSSQITVDTGMYFIYYKIANHTISYNLWSTYHEHSKPTDATALADQNGRGQRTRLQFHQTRHALFGLPSKWFAILKTNLNWHRAFAQ